MINSTLCFIKNSNNEYLMLYRNKKKNDLNEGKWITPGGKAEEGESSDDCVVREVYEETGLTITKFDFKGVIRFVSDVWEDEDIYLYEATEFSGKLSESCNEGTLKWFPANEILSLPTWEGDKYFIKPLLEGAKNINMKVQYEGEKLVDVTPLEDEAVIEKSSLIKCRHGFSTRFGGISEGVYSSLNLGMNRGDDRLRVCENWRRFLKACDIDQVSFVNGNQIHSSFVHIASKKDMRLPYAPGELIPADGYVTNESGVPLVIYTADCVPVLLEDSKAGVIGAVHCGWRSTVADIEKEAISKMISLGADPSNIVAAIGPAIEKCCFEVGYDVISEVHKLIGPEAETFYTPLGDKYMLDLKAVVRKRLIMLGLTADNIEYVGGCTMCEHDKYWSHRFTKGVRGSLASIICL